MLHGSPYCALERHTQGVVQTIEVYADVTCPFTHFGLRRLVERREQLDRHDVVLRVRAWPLELVNGEPLRGELVGEEIAELRAATTPDLFAGFNSIQFPQTSLPALMLEASAYLNDDRIGEEVSLALRTALFEQGRDVSDPAVLAAIAASVGIAIPGREAAQLVHADWHEGERRDVSGSPFFFVGGQGFFCPTLKIEHTEGHLKISVDPKATEAFFDHCFS
jgi:predicted DsbA family dithiol-disulfide isomerase